MIKLTKIAALSSSLVIFSGLTAHAFLLPPGPVTPTVDAPTDVTFSLENVGATAQMYAAQAQTYANNMTKAANRTYQRNGMRRRRRNRFQIWLMPATTIRKPKTYIR